VLDRWSKPTTAPAAQQEVKKHMNVLFYQEVEADMMQRMPARCRR
jgi:hypothetical protein